MHRPTSFGKRKKTSSDLYRGENREGQRQGVEKASFANNREIGGGGRGESAAEEEEGEGERRQMVASLVPEMSCVRKSRK